MITISIKSLYCKKNFVYQHTEWHVTYLYLGDVNGRTPFMNDDFTYPTNYDLAKYS